PDLITMAKGLTSAYVQLGAVGMRPKIAAAFQEKAFPGGLTYNSHPLACAAALATLAVYEEEGLIERAAKMGVVLHERMAERAPRPPGPPPHRRPLGGRPGWAAPRGLRSRGPRPTGPPRRWPPTTGSSASRASTRSRAGTRSPRPRRSRSARRS